MEVGIEHMRAFERIRSTLVDEDIEAVICFELEKGAQLLDYLWCIDMEKLIY